MKEGLSSLRALMLYEVILTLGLAGIMFLEGEVSSHLAVMTGSSLYKESLEALVKKDMNWYGKNYYLRTADKFNHVSIKVVRTMNKSLLRIMAC
jgi:hypothetical protein